MDIELEVEGELALEFRRIRSEKEFEVGKKPEEADMVVVESGRTMVRDLIWEATHFEVLRTSTTAPHLLTLMCNSRFDPLYLGHIFTFESRVIFLITRCVL